MKILLLSDIHANLSALETVLADAPGVDAVWNLGDTIGYGPRPNECLTLMRERAAQMIAGNHDLACLGLVDLSDFNPEARTANLWNGAQLDDERRAFLSSLPPSTGVDAQVMIAHGSPRDPIWEYLLTRSQAQENFDSPTFVTQICLIGHSHVPLFFRRGARGKIDGPFHGEDGMMLRIEPNTRYIINPGSVGQPRDQDPRAAYAIFDTDAQQVTFHRIAYDIEQTQQQMRAARLPEPLAARLQYGM